METRSEFIEVETMNTPTVLARVIELIQRKRVYIKKLVAEENDEDKETGTISIKIMTDTENVRLVKAQIQRIVDVIAVK